MSFKLKKILCLSFVGLVLAFLYVPLIVLFVFSFTESRSMGKWTGFSFKLYAQLFTDAEVLGAIGNTLVIGLVSAGLATIIGTITAVGMFHLRKYPKKIINTTNQITIINADIVTAVAFMLFFISVRVIPIFNLYLMLIIAAIIIWILIFIGIFLLIRKFYRKKHAIAPTNTQKRFAIINFATMLILLLLGVALMILYFSLRFVPDGYPTLIIAHTVITIPYVILSILPRLGQLNPNLYEAGLDAGASPMRTLFTVIVPQLVPAMIAGFALSFTLSLDDFVITKFNNGGVINTISTYIYSKLAKGGLKPVIRAASSLILIVSLLILIIVNLKSKKKNATNK